MPQSADRILDHAPLFREPEYTELLARKRENFECPASTADIEAQSEHSKGWEYREKNLAREALVINPAVMPVNSLSELIAAVRAKPGYYNYSSPGTGTLQQLGFELFKQHLGLDVQHVPYRGASQAITDFVSGQVHLTYLPVSSALPGRNHSRT